MLPTYVRTWPGHRPWPITHSTNARTYALATCPPNIYTNMARAWTLANHPLDNFKDICPGNLPTVSVCLCVCLSLYLILSVSPCLCTSTTTTTTIATTNTTRSLTRHSPYVHTHCHKQGTFDCHVRSKRPCSSTGNPREHAGARARMSQVLWPSSHA